MLIQLYSSTGKYISHLLRVTHFIFKNQLPTAKEKKGKEGKGREKKISRDIMLQEPLQQTPEWYRKYIPTQ